MLTSNTVYGKTVLSKISARKVNKLSTETGASNEAGK
jgi:hypothetical protein